MENIEEIGPEQKENKPSITRGEALQVVRIKEDGMPINADITLLNIEDLIKKGEQVSVEEQKEKDEENKLADLPLPDLMDQIYTRLRNFDSLQQNLFMLMDAEKVEKKIEETLEEKGLIIDKDSKLLLDVMKRRQGMLKEKIGLDEIELTKKIGDEKQNEQFIKSKVMSFGALRQPILDSLDTFEEANPNLGDIAPETKKKLDDLRTTLSSEITVGFVNDNISEIDRRYAEIIKYDRDANKEKLLAAARRLATK